MHFHIADSFTDALARLTAQEQKAVKTAAFDLQLNPAAPGLKLHRIDTSKDPNFWSVRVSRDLRIVVHKTAASFLLAYVDHHDKAYGWAERRRIEAHSRTGAIQIVEVRERVEEVATPAALDTAPVAAAREPRLFDRLSEDDLLSVGVPGDWLADVRAATEDGFLELADHLPAEAAEALLEFAATGILRQPEVVAPEATFAHPDSLRRFRVVDNVEELERALNAPWEKWTILLHPSQRAMVERRFSGPARVAGSAGTGKTVVALHRAARLAEAPGARVLLATFSRPLAHALERKLKLLVGERSGLFPRILVATWQAVAEELYELSHGRRLLRAVENVWQYLRQNLALQPRLRQLRGDPRRRLRGIEPPRPA